MEWINCFPIKNSMDQNDLVGIRSKHWSFEMGSEDIFSLVLSFWAFSFFGHIQITVALTNYTSTKYLRVISTSSFYWVIHLILP
jgi:hypothetical protein